MGNFNFNEYDTKDLEVKKPELELLKNIDTSNVAPNYAYADNKKPNFLKIPEGIETIMTNNQSFIPNNSNSSEQTLSVPYNDNNQNSYLSLVLSPNLRELELMIRGLEYVKITDALGREKIILKRIEGHPLNEYGINQILTHLKIYSSPEIKLGRKTERNYYNSVRQVSKSITRLIYKNLKKFGMETQEKQRNAKMFCLAIIELLDASYSRSIEGRENDLSRAEIKIEGSLDNIQDPAQYINKQMRENLKN